MDLKEIIEKAVEIYNRYRSPEATAKLVEILTNQFTIEFKGSFCQSCGVYDYFEDLIYEIKSSYPSLNIAIANIKESNGSFFVTYKVEF
ncbi:MAG: hypothetical protein QW476_03530 [Candidatus Bathyarchaeia archaeon]|nr:Rdx family protein [Candidatus Bathyarchaeota archaeon]